MLRFISMTDRLGPIEKTTNMGGVELSLGDSSKGKTKSEQLKETSDQLKTLMPYLWDSAKRLLVLTRGSLYIDTKEDFALRDTIEGSGFSVASHLDDDDMIRLPVASFMVKKDKKTGKIIRRDPIVVSYKVGGMKRQDGSRGDKYFESTRLVGGSVYDTVLATEENGEWNFGRGIGLKRRRRALGVAAAMLGRVEGAIASIEEDSYGFYPLSHPGEVGDSLVNIEMRRQPSGAFAPVVPMEDRRSTRSDSSQNSIDTLYS